MAAGIRKESGSIINGCSIVSSSRMSSRCRKCDYRDYCESKRRESTAAIVLDFRPDMKEDDLSTLAMSIGKMGVSADEMSEAIKRAMCCMAEKREK